MSLIRKCDIHVNSFKETRQSKQLHPKTTPFFLERKNELPQAGFEPATCTLVVLLGNQDFKDPYLRVYSMCTYMYVFCHNEYQSATYT